MMDASHSSELNENERAVRRMVEAMNERDMAAFYDLFADDVAFRSTGNPDGSGKADLRGLQDVLFETFPDRHEHIEWLLAKDEWVVARIRVKGTNTGKLWGLLPPTNQQAEFVVHDIYRFQHGLIQEFWTEGNFLAVMQQLGVIPS